MNPPVLSPLSIAVAIGLFSTSVWSSNGNVITVDTLADGSLPDACTLRDALRAAATEAAQGGCSAGQPGQNQILIAPSGTLSLSEGALEVTSDVIISGTGIEALTIDAGGQSRIFEVDGTGFPGQANDLVLTDMSLRNVGPSLAGGGAIFLREVDQALIERLAIRDGFRGGIRAQYSGNLRVVDSVISNTTQVGISADLGGPGGSLELDNVTLADNLSGLWCRCDLELSNSTISGNGGFANGGGIETYLSNASITDTVISGNSTGNVGGAYLNVYDLQMRRVTISGNSGGLAGGLLLRTLGSAEIEGISVFDNQASGLGGPAGTRGVGGVLINTRPLGELSISNSTISANTGSRAGGIDFDDNAAGSTRLDHLTVTDNEGLAAAITGGLSFRVNLADLSITNSVIADNRVPQGPADDIVAWTRAEVQDPIVPGADLMLSYSLVEHNSGFNPQGSGNLLGQAAELGPLADNGGPTLSHAPLPGSPVLNAGDPAFNPPPAFDQRGTGFPRVLGGRLDMGAIEADFDQIFTDRFQLP